MIKAIGNKALELTEEEYTYYLELEKSFGKEVFVSLFSSDKNGYVTAITPSISNPTAMALIFFLFNVMHNQRLRQVGKHLKKIKDLEARLELLENKVK